MTEFTNLERLRQKIQANDTYPMARTMNFRLIAVDDGSATFEATPEAKFINPWDRIHGGYTAALLDSALGTAVATKLAVDVPFGTINLNISYVKGVDLEQGNLTCTAHVLHAGRTMFTAEAKVTDNAGKLYAHGTGTFLVYPNK